MNIEFKEKYLKYKKKYFGLKNILVGGQMYSPRIPIAPGQYMQNEYNKQWYFWGKNSFLITNTGGSVIIISYPKDEYHKYDLLKLLDDYIEIRTFGRYKNFSEFIMFCNKVKNGEFKYKSEQKIIESDKRISDAKQKRDQLQRSWFSSKKDIDFQTYKINSVNEEIKNYKEELNNIRLYFEPYVKDILERLENDNINDFINDIVGLMKKTNFAQTIDGGVPKIVVDHYLSDDNFNKKWWFKTFETVCTQYARFFPAYKKYDIEDRGYFMSDDEIAQEVAQEVENQSESIKERIYEVYLSNKLMEVLYVELSSQIRTLQFDENAKNAIEKIKLNIPEKIPEINMKDIINIDFIYQDSFIEEFGWNEILKKSIKKINVFTDVENIFNTIYYIQDKVLNDLKKAIDANGLDNTLKEEEDLFYV